MFSILNPSTWDTAGSGLREFQTELSRVHPHMVDTSLVRAWERVIVAEADRAGECLGRGFPALPDDMAPALRRALRRMFLWQGAFSEAVTRGVGFEQRGEASMARHWYDAARRRSTFASETQATAIALASK